MSMPKKPTGGISAPGNKPDSNDPQQKILGIVGQAGERRDGGER